ncbi:anthranilate synthase subunit I [Candidatus Magnetoovum chiemensis]|nr:anthranilate synthase subunit I [Candidatus Magnetoovum chiemensis]
MFYPSFKKFKELSEKGNLIPVYKEILADMETPVCAFNKIKGKHSFLLESVVGGEKWARFSFLGDKPSKIIQSYGDQVEIITENGEEKSVLTVKDPTETLRQELSKYKAVSVGGLPRFWGGLVGYLGYDTVRFFERMPENNKPSLNMPDMLFMLTDTILIFDNLRQTIKVLSNAYIDNTTTPEKAYSKAVEKIESTIERIRRCADTKPIELISSQTEAEFTSSFNSKASFLEAVDKCKEYIRAGDIFQAVLSQRFEIDTEVDAFNVYRALRVINPSPYMYYLNTGDGEIVGSSPEILVRLEDSKITLKPIAGTRKRGINTDKEGIDENKDKKMEEELKNDPKEIAEHIMLVDLGRNDVGRAAQIGTVKVTEMMTIEKYSHVMHMVTNVEGKLKEELDAFDLLRATFPAGTVTGAPKVRAMEIISELEPIKRGSYAGAVGYIGYCGNMDTCITIRTLIIKDGKVYVQAGAGIVADSVAELEFMETINKAKAMMSAVNLSKNTGGQNNASNDR